MTQKTFYTNVQMYGSRILYRGVFEGQRVTKKFEYSPTLFVPSQDDSKYKSILGENLKPIQLDGIREARDFVNRYKDVDGFPVYGQTRYEYSFIADMFEDEIDWDWDLVQVANIDIETKSDNGFPKPELANEEITAITFKMNNRLSVFGTKPFTTDRSDIDYYLCSNEVDLLKTFITVWSRNYPDIITGWNIKEFDIPYLVNRITKILGDAEVKKLSPWNVISEREVKSSFRSYISYTFMGIATLDYIELYKKYAPKSKSQENHKLNTIAASELGEKKIDYSSIGTIRDLHDKDYQLFIEYNIQDVELIDKLDEKLKLLELVLTQTYKAKSNYEDAFGQVRMWDVIISDHLLKKNIIIPPHVHHEKAESFDGAFVKPPQIALHHWVVSLDLTSLYPSLIIQGNISPETLIEPVNYPDELRLFVSQNTISVENMLSKSIDFSILKKYDLTVTPNGQFYTKSKEGFMPELARTMFEDRQKYKKLMLSSKKALELETEDVERYELVKSISRYNNLQLSTKVNLNSLYGTTGTPYFRYFDIRNALAVTSYGQLAFMWTERHLNEYMNKLLGTVDVDYIIAGDTDSVFLSMDAFVKETILKQKPTATTREVVRFIDKVVESKIQPFIDRFFQDLADYTNAPHQRMDMKREKICDKGFWTAKKRYALRVWNNEGVELAEPEIAITGLEIIQSSTPTVCKPKMKEIIDLIFTKTEKDVIESIEEFRKDFNTFRAEDIARLSNVNGLEKYADATSIFGKKTPMHVRGSLFYNHLLKKYKLEKIYPTIQEGEKIKYVHLKLPNIIKSDTISFIDILPKEFDISDNIDYDAQFDKVFLEPIKTILNVIGWKTKEVASLADFF